MLSEISRIYAEIDRKRLPIRPVGMFSSPANKTTFSIFTEAIGVPPAQPINNLAEHRQWQLISDAASEDPACGAAIASLIGLALGDGVGAPLEFSPVDSAQPADYKKGVFPESRPCVLGVRKDSKGRPVGMRYRNADNKFKLQPGQWTDDCSMACGLADSLLVHKGYHGGDARNRWHMWWNYGYCNAFRFGNKKRASIGLGGNIEKSLSEIDGLRNGENVDDISPFFGVHESEDAGNGSIMRLAPVAIAFHNDLPGAIQIAEWQSRATHPGADAVACCKFLTYFIAKAIHSHKSSENVRDSVRNFMDKTISSFLKEFPSEDDSGLQKVHAVLRSEPPSRKEANWDWRRERLQIEEAIKQRKGSANGRYNGYPVILVYWGAYCMDGLAMALWALYHSTSFSECLLKTINLLGDADTTGAIAGQMAGAVYGWEGIVGSETGRTMLKDLRQWDPYCEVLGVFIGFFFFVFLAFSKGWGIKRGRKRFAERL